MMINNPDDMGIYNPEIKEWVRVAQEAGGALLLRPRELQRGDGQAVGARARLRRLHVHAPQDLRRAEGGRRPGRRGLWLHGRAGAVSADARGREAGRAATRSTRTGPKSAGKVREFWGNVPQVVKAYAWARAMGAEGIQMASDISVVANNYMDKRLARDPGPRAVAPAASTMRRMEMTRWSLGPLTEATGVGTVDFANRMADYGIDPWWMSHEPWIVPEPFTPEAGELWSKEDIDLWIDVVAKIAEEARENPRAGEDRAAQPAHRAGEGRGVRGPVQMGDDLAGVEAQAGGRGREARRGLSAVGGPVSVGEGRDSAGAGCVGGWPSTRSAAMRAVIGPALKPIQGNSARMKPGRPGASPMIGRQSGVPLTMAVQLRTRADAGQARGRRPRAMHHVAGEALGVGSERAAGAARGRPAAADDAAAVRRPA